MCSCSHFCICCGLLAGSFATGNVVSHWLLAFALTLFLSLALCKRVSELSVWRSIDHGAPRDESIGAKTSLCCK